MSAAAKQPFKLRGVHVLALMLAFFGLVIAVNVVFAVVAVRSFPGEDVRRSYLQGLHYNDTLAERRAQAALGWQAATALVAADAGAALEIRLAARDGAPVNADIAGELQRPTDARLDRALVFTQIAPGVYRAEIGALEAGVWRLRAHAGDADGGALDFESELIWQASR